MREAYARPLLVCLALCLLASCASLVDKAGAALDGSAFKKTPEGVIVIKSGFPNLTFYGISAGAQGGRVQLTHYTFFCSSVWGWNEFTMDVLGAATVAGGRVTFSAPIEAAGISSGKIRRGETRLTGGEALTALTNRRERLAALAGWMRAQNPAPVFASQKAFEAYWKPILLPELSAKRLRVTEYNAPGSPAWQKGTAEWSFAEDVRWNKTYTALVFPEHLRAFRDSGALLRDWEESAAWLYLEYSWDEIASRG
jgi:hypothetical protein